MSTRSPRFIPHPDSLSNSLNVDELWVTLVRDLEKVQRETMQRPDPKLLLSAYVGLGGTVMMSRIVASFSDLGPPHDTILRSTLSRALSSTNIEQMVRTLYRGLQAAQWYPQIGSKISFLETPVGIATIILLYVIESGNNIDSNTGGKKIWEVCTEILQNGFQVLSKESRGSMTKDDANMDVDADTDDGCEVLYGRAGFLYALLRLRASVYRCVPRPHEGTDEKSRKLWNLISDENLRMAIHSIVERGRVGAKFFSSETGASASPPLMWSWHHKRYLGGAHGVAGILHVLLMCPTQLISAYVAEMLGTIEWLIDLQDKEGNWPSSFGKSRDHENDLVQWCHGAPGLLILFSTLIRRCHTNPSTFSLTPAFASSLISALHNAEVLVYTRGFLRKGVGLCHGVSGSVYALLAASDAVALLQSNPEPPPGQQQQQQPQTVLQIDRHDEFSRAYFLHAVHLAYLATGYRALEVQGEMSQPDRPWSLYEGLGGMCCAWAEVYDRLSTTGRNLAQTQGRTGANGQVGSTEGGGSESTTNLNLNPRLQWARSRSGMPGYDDMIVD
ncbi:hypothetical protein D9758_005798 [Tetrapyrgos nigripes]|uniref:LanC-like protein 2 n=1 Tax=Tetrapyrgos nigripes TaxID=182062 RepID=A0A8H5GK82_9AGAR|nr:hypothetical protein D9758_005798 [Tetrapyrgos nigripes]